MLQYLNGHITRHIYVRKILLKINEDEYFTEFSKTTKFLPDAITSSDFVVMEIPENDLKVSKYKNFFDHFSIKSVYNDVIDPIYELISTNDSFGTPSEYLVISSFMFQNKPMYCITGDKTVFISELKIESISKMFGDLASSDEPFWLRYTLHDYKNKFLQKYKLIIFNTTDSNHKEIVNEFRDVLCIPLEFTTSVLLGGISFTMKAQYDLHIRMKERYQQLSDISHTFNIPIGDVNNNRILDIIYYKEMTKANMICIESDEFVLSVFRDETYKSMYYPTYCIQIECVESLLLSIIEYNVFISDRSLFDGIKRKEFTFLVEMLKKLLIASLKNDQGSNALLKDITFWLKKGSRFLSSSLRELLNSLQQQYLVNLVAKIRVLQCKVISVSKELITIDTGKNDLQGCQMYFQYIKSKVAAIPGYELLKLKRIRFEKLAFINPSNYFYLENSTARQFSNINIPSGFIDLYFSDATIHNDFVYDTILQVNRSIAKIILRLISYKRDTHGLVYNCYKLIRMDESRDDTGDTEYESFLTIFCKKCRMENLLRKNCLKCFAEIDRPTLESIGSKYLNYLWGLQIDGDRSCIVCGACEERKLREYCRCGGKFVAKDYKAEIMGLKSFINTQRFNKMADTVLNYFC